MDSPASGLPTSSAINGIIVEKKTREHTAPGYLFAANQAVTVTVQVAVLPFLVFAVMVAVPAAMP